MINRENYETYFIDYLEGNLDELLVNDFIEFLQNNPDLKEELSLFETVSVEPENVSFSKKEKLYKEKYDSEKEFDKAAIACLEGDISKKEKTKLYAHISKHPEKKRAIILFGKTKLQPDESIVFSNKKSLYKRSGRKIFLLWSGRIAAILILAFAFFTIMDKPTIEIAPSEKIVELEDTKEKTSTPVELKKSAVKTEKEVPVKIKKVTTKPAVKKVTPKTQTNKSLRENTNGRMTHEDLAINRTPIESLSKIEGITASINTARTKATLATMYISIPEDYYEENLLVSTLKEKTGLDKLTFKKVTKSGLNFVSNISKEKFKYETNEKGKITEYNYNSRILAFSFPTKKIKSE